MKKLSIILASSFLFLTSACTASNGRYAALSDKPINLYNVSERGSKIASNVSASSSRSIFVVVPSDDVPSVEEAVSAILSKYNGDYLANAEITHTGFHLLWAYHYSSWNVKGDVMRAY